MTATGVIAVAVPDIGDHSEIPKPSRVRTQSS